jgi:predicted enzyme involved in methoxymalonyl-ACP biosynthesis
MEFAMMDELVARLKARGVKELRGHYLPTAKNKMVKNFYGDMGFTLVEEKEDGSSDWKLDLSGYENQNKHIKMN